MSISFSSSDPLVGRHIRHYRELLQDNSPISLSDLDSTYLDLKPLIHSHVSDPTFDVDGFSYASSRLPSNIFEIRKIIISSSLGQAASTFALAESRSLTSPNRRRLIYQDDQQTILVIINSYTDLDDFINNLIAYRFEYKKIKQLQISDYPDIVNAPSPDFNPEINLLPVKEDDFVNQSESWLSANISQSLFFGLVDEPTYFVSSNSHSLVNLIGGFLNTKQSYIFDYIAKTHPRIYEQWFTSKVEHNQSQVNDFLYYLSQKFLGENQEFIAEKNKYEKQLGIITLPVSSFYPIEMQIIPLRSLSLSANPDHNLISQNLSSFSNSHGTIVNIQYPLGMSAKYILDQFLAKFKAVKGVYIIGKAAILNGSVGDIQIPDIVFDESTNNIYQLDNIFSNNFIYQGVISQILTHQKAACVYGSLLENQGQIENYKKSGFNIIEMESGHFLSSIVEKYMLQSPVSQSRIYKVSQLPIDLGIINYASDNPLTENLSKESIDFRGIETTYLSSLNVLNRIIHLESK